MEFLLIFLAGVVDRIRGDSFHILYNRIFDKIAYGWIVSALIGHPFDWFTLGFVGLFGIGMSLGWGGPMGCYLGNRQMLGEGERWQKGFLKTNIHAALWFRGLLWGGCVLPLAVFDTNIISVAIASTVAFPLSLYISKHIIRQEPYVAWKVAEYVRGWMIGIFTYIMIGL